MSRLRLVLFGVLPALALLLVTVTEASAAPRRQFYRGYGYYPRSGFSIGFSIGSPGYYRPYYGYGYYTPRYFYSYPSTSYYSYPSTYYYSYPSYYVPMYRTYSPPVYSSSDATGSYEAEETGAASARVEVRVPADAQVWFDDQRTRQTGAVRTFESPPLTPGRNYSYEVRARWQENGRDVEQKRKVEVFPGRRSMVDFTQPAGERIDTLPRPDKE